MKKTTRTAVLCFLMVLALTGCAGPEPAAPALTQTPAPQITDAPQEPQAEAESQAHLTYDHVDMDLTKLNSFMVYAQIYNMAASPDTYQGQVVRLKGTFSIRKGANPDGGDAYSLVTYDEEACCTQEIGLTFARAEQLPKNGREATVTGIFEGYRENGANYCRLSDAVLN